MEGERKEEGLYAPHPFLDISAIYAKYLAYILGSATEIVIKITLVDDFVSFDILNCKNYLHLSIKSKFNNRNTTYQSKVYGKKFSLPCLHALVSVIKNI